MSILLSFLQLWAAFSEQKTVAKSTIVRVEEVGDDCNMTSSVFFDFRESSIAFMLILASRSSPTFFCD